MAISKYLPDVQVCVRIAGRTLEEYRDTGQEPQRVINEESLPDYVRKRTTARYVCLEPTDSDTTYSLKLDFQQDYDFENMGLVCQIDIDGRRIGSTLIEQRHVGSGVTTIRFKGPFTKNGKNVIQHSTEFENAPSDADPKITCKCRQRHYELFDEVGNIVVTFFKCSATTSLLKGGPRELVLEADKNDGPAKHIYRLMKCTCEEAVAARKVRTLTHYTLFVDKESTWIPRLGDDADIVPAHSVKPTAVFTFRYRTRETLKTLGVMAQSENVASPETSDFTDTDIDEVESVKMEDEDLQPAYIYRPRHYWTPQEDQILLAARKTGKEFAFIQAQHFPALTSASCNARWAYLQRASRPRGVKPLPKRKWTALNGIWQPADINGSPSRNASIMAPQQLYEDASNHGIIVHGSWSAKDDENIVQAHQAGHDSEAIQQAYFPERTLKAVQCRQYLLLTDLQAEKVLGRLATGSLPRMMQRPSTSKHLRETASSTVYDHDGVESSASATAMLKNEVSAANAYSTLTMAKIENLAKEQLHNEHHPDHSFGMMEQIAQEERPGVDIDTLTVGELRKISKARFVNDYMANATMKDLQRLAKQRIGANDKVLEDKSVKNTREHLNQQDDYDQTPPKRPRQRRVITLPPITAGQKQDRPEANEYSTEDDYQYPSNYLQSIAQANDSKISKSLKRARSQLLAGRAYSRTSNYSRLNEEDFEDFSEPDDHPRSSRRSSRRRSIGTENNKEQQHHTAEKMKEARAKAGLDQFDGDED